MLNLLPLEFVQDWGWRIPFLLGVVVGYAVAILIAAAAGFLLQWRLARASVVA